MTNTTAMTTRTAGSDSFGGPGQALCLPLGESCRKQKYEVYYHG